MISSLDNLLDMFKKMNDNGFNTSAPLKWGFYFVDADKGKLQSVFNELKDNNYLLEDIYLSDDNNWTLHASKIDTLTPEKLHKRNNAFNELADYCNVELYDGWDVEKI
jgi:Regulator of ribonuclease activity B